MKAEGVDVALAGPVQELMTLLKDVRKMGRVDVCRAEALGALVDASLDDATARQKARQWLEHAYR